VGKADEWYPGNAQDGITQVVHNDDEELCFYRTTAFARSGLSAGTSITKRVNSLQMGLEPMGVEIEANIGRYLVELTRLTGRSRW
jgi:hypothetical protein